MPPKARCRKIPEFAIPFGKANIVQEGKDVTIVTSLLYVSRTMEAVKELEAEGISCEVIDPRTLVPLDTENDRELRQEDGPHRDGT